jgi:hypothetical protein
MGKRGDRGSIKEDGMPIRGASPPREWHNTRDDEPRAPAGDGVVKPGVAEPVQNWWGKRVFAGQWPRQ